MVVYELETFLPHNNNVYKRLGFSSLYKAYILRIQYTFHHLQNSWCYLFFGNMSLLSSFSVFQQELLCLPWWLASSGSVVREWVFSLPGQGQLLLLSHLLPGRGGTSQGKSPQRSLNLAIGFQGYFSTPINMY